MSVTLYMGRAGSGKSYACYERIRQIMTEQPGEPIILLVPDSATYQAERELAAFMPQKGFVTVRVVGFGRLAHQVFQSVGHIQAQGLSDIGQKLILRLLLKRHQKELEVLGQAAKQPHFADVLQQLYSECDAFRVTPADLRAKAPEMASLPLQRKLTELATLQERYEELVGQKLGLETSVMEALLRLLPQSPLLQEAHVFIDGFHWFTPLQFEILYTLLDTAKEGVVTLTLPTDAKERARLTKKGALFARPWEIYTKLTERYGTSLQVRSFAASKRYETPLLEALESHYFTSPMRRNPTERGLHVWEGYNREREADAVCRQILKLMTEGKRRWRDFALILRDTETYGDILEKALQRYEIPFFSDRRHPMVSHPLAEFLMGLLEIVRYRFQHDAVFRLLKTDFFALSRREVDELENYCLAYGVSEFDWLKENWQYHEKRKGAEPAAGEGVETAQAGAAEPLTAGEDIRQAEPRAELEQRVTAEQGVPVPEETFRSIQNSHTYLLNLLKPWYEFAQKSHTGQGWCRFFFTFMQQVGVPQVMSTWCRQLAEGDTGREQEEIASHEQMYKQVLAFFDEVERVGAEEELTLEELMLLLKEGLEEVTYSLVPPTLDHVTVTTIERGYTREAPIVFVLGLNEGIFPQRLGDEGLLKDREREALREAGLVLAEGALLKAFNENFLFYLACTRAKEELYLSYAVSEGEGGALEASLPVRRLRQQGYVAQVSYVPLTVTDEQAVQYLWRPKQSISLLAGQLSLLRQGEPMAPLWWQLYDWARQDRYRSLLRYAVKGVLERNLIPPLDREIIETLLLRGSELGGSVTRIERYQQCPFRFYAQYVLQLEPRKVKQFGAPEIGIYLHENLRQMGEYLLRTRRQWRDIPSEQRTELCQAVAEETARELAGGGSRAQAQEEILRQRLAKTLESTVARLTDWSCKSTFNTVYVEQNFGSYGSSWPPVYIPLQHQKTVRLQGQIDRVDYLQEAGRDYALVVDYKSGGTRVAAYEIYYGLKLQLLTYLLALEYVGGAVPAAAVYTYVQNPQVKAKRPLTEEEAKLLAESENTVKNQGYFLRDTDILLHLDHTLPNGGSPHVPIRLKKDGTIYAQDVRKTKSREEFSVLTDYARKLIAEAGNRILEGQFPISPYNLDGRIPCSFCQYRTVCRFEGQGEDTKYRYLKRLSEADSLAKMVEGADSHEMDS